MKNPLGKPDESLPAPRPAAAYRGKYVFGEFTLDLDAGFLRRGPQEVTLRPKAFEVLAYLVKHHGRLVSKTELIEAVWPETSVTDNSLAQSLLEVRRALADDSQQVIRTVKKRGYMFAAPVKTPVLELTRQSGGAETQLRPLAAQAPFLLRTSRRLVIGGFAFAVAVTGTILLLWRTSATRQEVSYEQLTNFPDSVLAPALSPDGRMVAFYRSDSWFLTPDQIYVKMLPGGEPVQLTQDSKWKYGLAFSPDGSRIAYTTAEGGPLGWKTYTVSVLGGQPTLLLSNAAGLTWLDQRRLLFSEVRTGEHMGLVTATVNRSEYRRIYFPQNERGMVHTSFVSPDQKWVLVTEMDPAWHPCRLVPLDGRSAGWQVGPEGACSSAAWSPDGRWMYFAAEVRGEHHLWRQRFADGNPEQITFGPTHEEGLAMAPDGHSLITSIGTDQSALWIHDQRGDRLISSEGSVVSLPGWSSSARFSADGKRLFYLMRRESPAAPAELWRTDLESGNTELVLPGFSVVGYDVSADGQEVVFSTQASEEASQIWLAPWDRSSSPRLIGSTGASSRFAPHFGPDGHVLFVMREGTRNYLARMKRDGSGRSKVVPDPISGIYGGVSPDRRWVAVSMPAQDVRTGAIVAVPTNGGAPRRLCEGFRPVAWAPDGKFFYIGVTRSSRSRPGETLAIPLRPGESLPDLPPSGIRDAADAAAFPGSRIIAGWEITPGADPSVFAYVKRTMHRNLFRIPLRRQ